jgi:hypothetical protein
VLQLAGDELVDVGVAGGVLDVTADAGEGRARHRNRGDPEAREVGSRLEIAHALVDGVSR